MPDTKQLLRETRDRIAPPPDVLGGLERRRRHKENVKRASAAAVGIAVALIGLGGWFLLEREAAPRPADDRSEELGIFAPVAGRILFVNEDAVAVAGYDPGPWAIDPSGPADTTAGPRVADDVVATLVPLGPKDAIPIDWSDDGTALLFERMHGDLIVQTDLYILHADGSETLLVEGYGGGATITPDGTRVVFSGECGEPGLCVVDADGGQPAPLPFPSDKDAYSPTFSPDGTRIAYLVHEDDDLTHVWVADVDGSAAPRDILAAEETRSVGAGGLQWSPAGDRLAFGVRGFEGNGDVSSIYTFAPDGSDFTRVITHGDGPSWSPDGSQIAYTINCTEGSPDPSCGDGGIVLQLAIADADGSNVRAFGFGTSGPWHPGVSATDEPVPTPVETPTPTPVEVDDGLLRSDGDVLSFTGNFDDAPGDLVAVDPGTGEERPLAEDLADVFNARWSADGRWVAFETPGSLWVVDRTGEPLEVFSRSSRADWTWSSTGARLAVVRGSTLNVIDPATGRVTQLASTVGDVTSAPAWFPDGTRILLGARGGSVYSVDVGTGERSLIVQLPGEVLDSIDGIEWSPDGSRLVIVIGTESGHRLFVLNPDGSDARELADGARLVFGFDWSPDGSRIAFTEDHGGELHVFVAPADGSTRSLVASLANAPSNPVWSPDGMQIALGHRNAFLTEDAPNLVIDANGSGVAVPLNDLTYESWRGGSYDCDCDIFG